MQPTTQRGIYFLLLLILIFGFVTFVLSAMQFFGGQGFGGFAKAGKIDSSFFDSQNAMVSGTITAVKDRTITIQNKNGVKKDFKLSQYAIIMSLPQSTSPTNGAAPVAPTSDIKNIEIGKQASINLTAVKGELEVNSITPAMNAGPATIPPAIAPGKPASAATNSAVPNPPASSAPTPKP